MNEQTSLNKLSPADQMLTLVFECDYLSQTEKLERLQVVGKQVGGLLGQGWQRGPAAAATLHTAAAYACMPSLAATIEGRPQTKAVAKRVTNNFRVLYGEVLSSELGNPDALDEREDHRFVVGQMSEIAIIGTMWWGIVSGQHSRGSSILPTTTAQDRAPVRGGCRTGHDAVIRDIFGNERKLQIKSTLKGESNWEKIQTYSPDITVIAPTVLTYDGGRYPSLKLLKILVDNDCRALRLANQRASHFLEKNQAKSHGSEVAADIAA